jgi:hypothetical protein
MLLLWLDVYPAFIILSLLQHEQRQLRVVVDVEVLCLLLSLSWLLLTARGLPLLADILGLWGQLLLVPCLWSRSHLGVHLNR